jgi:hypothetical protein
MPRNARILIRSGTAAPSAADFDVAEPAWDKTNGRLYVKDAAGQMVLIASDGFTGGTLTNNLTLAAGTASLSPLTLKSGTNLTTAAAGAVEFDGKVLYTTPASRGVSPSMMFYRLNSSFAGSNATAVQPFFGVGVSLAASTVYAFEANVMLRKSAGTTSHTIGLSMDSSSTLNNIHYLGTFATVASPSTGGANTTNSSLYSTSAGNIVITSAITTASQQVQFSLRGTLSTNLSTTFTPSYFLSAAPGGAYSTFAGSYIAIWPIGTAGANTSVGPWA